MEKGILIFGANGCGKSTAGRLLAQALGVRFLDAEAFAFAYSSVPFAVPRPREEYLRLVRREVMKEGGFVLASVKGNFGAEVISRYGCAFYLETDRETRLQRVRKRSLDRFGDRALRGGDLYEAEERFFAFVRDRPVGEIARWGEESLSCPVLRIDAALPVGEVVRQMTEYCRRHLLG